MRKDKPSGNRGNSTGRPQRDDRGAKPAGGDRKRFAKNDDGDDRKPRRSFRDNDEQPKRSFGEDRPKRSYNKDNEDRPKRSYRASEDNEAPKRSFNDRTDRPKRSFNEDRPKRSFKRDDDDRPKRSYGDGDDKPKRNYNRSSEDGDRPKRNFSDRTERPKRSFDENKPKRSFKRDDDDRPKRSYGDRDDKPKRSFKKDTEDAGAEKRKRVKGDSPDKFFAKAKTRDEKRARKFDGQEEADDKPRRVRKPIVSKQHDEKEIEEVEIPQEVMPLNKYLAHCGVASRREAADIIKEGKVMVNGAVMLQPGYKIQPGDEVTYNGKTMFSQKNLIYVLLNKPKNYLTTTDDPKSRKTVMELVQGVEERIYPVGRLDRNTTGLLLLTNDGELAQKLSHPKYNIKKVYQVTLDKALSKEHFEQIINGLTLEDGPVKVDALAYLEEKTDIGIEIHSGRNRIVRRIFEHLGYVVEKLDRVMYAGLTKKNIPRGKWRFLSDKEIVILKHFKQ